MVLGLLWANTSFANHHKPNNFDAFVWSDGKKLKIQKECNQQLLETFHQEYLYKCFQTSL